MLRKNTTEKITKYCQTYDVDVVNIRSTRQSGKTRIIITCRCKECGARFDIKWDTLQRQKYKGLCTKCAHKECSKCRVLTIQQIIKRFEDVGYKVITPINQIKPRGKRNVYFTPVEIMNKYGDVYTTNCNNFCSRIDYYKELSNQDKRNEMLRTESRLEHKVRRFLEENNIPYKQQFRFMDCRGKKYPLPFDFCLYYKEDKKLLIEVQGEQHFRESSYFHEGHEAFKTLQKHDRTKAYYCKEKQIPLLVLSYNKIDNAKESYKDIIMEFINNNR